MTTPERMVVRFKRHHLDWLMARSASAEAGLHLPVSEAVYVQLERGNSWTVVVDGDPVACAGTIEQWPGRHQAWAYFARGTLPHMVWITGVARANLAAVKGRIEFTVRMDFPAGQRWARELGFEVETPCLKAYGPLGEDHVGYVRVN